MIEDRDRMSARLFDLARTLWPMHRSLAGSENRRTLQEIKSRLPSLGIFEVPSGKHVFDWVVPDEWIIRSAWIKDSSGKKVVDIANNNLHIVSYSSPVNRVMSLSELKRHVITDPGRPNAIPYATSYYNRTWGFCMAYSQFVSLEEGDYEVLIDAEFIAGSMSYGEYFIQGQSNEEILFSTYICHPSMANNEISGIVITTALAEYLSTKSCYYSYRFLFLPETIGAIAYISENFDALKSRLISGYVLTCVGDDRGYSYVKTRAGNTYTDRVIGFLMESLGLEHTAYEWRDRASDERQFGAPHINLPVISLSRTRPGRYPEYHTSDDRLGVTVKPYSLADSLLWLIRLVHLHENNYIPSAVQRCEPFLSRYGLYPSIGAQGLSRQTRLTKDVLAYSDGELDLINMSRILEVSFEDLLSVVIMLEESGLITLSRVKVN
jgi:aminopeptidase-like protein